MRSLFISLILLTCCHQSFALTNPLYVHGEDTNVVREYASEQVEVITTEPDRLPYSSTGDLVKALRESLQPRTLVCHGKAAADCLEALILHPEIHSKVQQWVVLDGYIQGAPGTLKAVDPLPLMEVQKAEKMPLILGVRFVFDTLVQFFYGFDRVQYHFRPDQRKLYLNQYRKEIQNIAQNIKIVSIDHSHEGYGYMPFSSRAP